MKHVHDMVAFICSDSRVVRAARHAVMSSSIRAPTECIL